MPLYPYRCSKCDKEIEVIASIDSPAPECCGGVMNRSYSGSVKVKMGYPGWVDRIDEIHKRQADRGEKLRLPHPKEVGAT